MNKKEQLENMRREHARDRQEIRDNEWFIRDGEDSRIQRIRDNMTRILHDAGIEAEQRKEKLATLKGEIELILDARDEREHNFIEQELQRHQMEQELEQEIEQEEKLKLAEEKSNAQGESLNLMFRARSSLTVGAEQMRKNIEESRKELNEAEQFSTILINNSERDNIPSFINTKSRRMKEVPPLEQIARIDTIVIKQREIGMMYRESQELQESQLKKLNKKPLEKPPEKPPELPPEKPPEQEES